MHALISAKVTTNNIETQLKYVLSFTAMDETPTFITDHLLLPKNLVQKIPGQTCNFSHQKNLLI